MNTTPLISVIMSVYNGESYLRETLESIINQTFENWELVVINDCSLDATLSILNEYASRDKRIRVYTNETNLKLPASLNKAISLTKGKYVARMDADDICLTDRFEKQYEYMEKNPKTDVSACNFFTLKNGCYAPGRCAHRCDSDAVSALLLVTNPIIHPGVIAKREVFEACAYDTSLTCTEDLELWTRLTSLGVKIELTREYLLIYRLHDKQITSTTLEKQHTEVLSIEKKYYTDVFGSFDEDLSHFFISGIYFKENICIDKYIAYLKKLRRANAKAKAFSRGAIDYAMLEILAEYKRCGAQKKDIIKALIHFNPLFLIKEIIRRKKASRTDIASSILRAKSIGLERSGTSDDFPIFYK